MAYTYSALQTDLNAKLRNQLNNVTNVRTLINSAVRAELASFDYQSLIRHTVTARSLYDSIYLYPLPADMNDEAIIDFVKYSNFNESSNKHFRKVNIRKFNSNMASDTFSFDYSFGARWLKANLPTTSGTLTLHTMDSLTDNGTWTAADDGTSITTSTTNHVSGSAAISITNNSGTAVSVVNSIATQIDVSTADKLFVWVYLPDSTAPSSVTLLYGSSAANYYTTSATTPFNVDSFVQGWNLVAFDTGTAVGAPDNTAIDYLKVTINFAAANTGVYLIDNILATNGDNYEIIYYSLYGWRTSAGTWMEDSTANDDLLNVNANEYEIFLNRISYEAAKAIPMGDVDISRIYADYQRSKREYQLKYPSQRQRTKTSY